MKAMTIMFGGCLLACTGGREPAGDAAPVEVEFPRQCPATACAPGSTITGASELVAMIEATADWVSYGPYTTGCLQASADIHVSGAVTVQADSIAVPAFCQSRADCRNAVRFRAKPLPPGVECLAPEQWYGYTLCAGLTLRDITIRVRTVLQDIHPSGFGNAAPVVDVVSACAAPCGSAELACEATHTCWANVRDHCAYCLGASNEACACWDGARFQADGKQCNMAISGDVFVTGTCRAGTCEQAP
jgi:hypothetical protein